MKFYVKKSSSGECHVIPYNDGHAPVKRLKEVVLGRLYTGLNDGDSASYRLSMAGSEALLNDEDIVQDVLQDGDYLLLSSKQLFTDLDTVPTTAPSNYEDTCALPTYNL